MLSHNAAVDDDARDDGGMNNIVVDEGSIDEGGVKIGSTDGGGAEEDTGRHNNQMGTVKGVNDNDARIMVSWMTRARGVENGSTDDRIQTTTR